MASACVHDVAFETVEIGERIHNGCQQIQQNLLIFNNKAVQAIAGSIPPG